MSSTTATPPQNVDAEKALLGALLVTDSAWAAVANARLRTEDFYLDRHRAIFGCISELADADAAVDELTVVDALRRRDELDASGGQHYVSELAAKVPAAGNAKHYAEIVLSAAATRAKREIGLELTNGLPPEAAIERLVALQGRTAAADPSSWTAVDLGPAIEGEGRDPAPTILSRADGPSLLYTGKLHQVSAEPEAGKGWFALRATADLIGTGLTVIYVDFESDAPEIVARLLALEVSPDQILSQLIYLRPHEPLTDLSRAELDGALSREPALVVLDGVTEALTIHGLDLGDNADIARWLELLPRPAIRAGAAVLMIDHVVKDREARGRYAIGAQHKLAGIDVAYSLEVVEPFGRGKNGLVKVKVAKDRPGHVRQHAEGEHVALMRLASDAGSGSVSVTLDPPDATDDEGEFRPTALMERVSRAIEANPGLNREEVLSIAGGKREYTSKALTLLTTEGFVEPESVGRAKLHRSVRPYREADDAS
jgi:hypothetical protein